MGNTYKYNHTVPRHLIRHVLQVLITAVVVIAILIGLIVLYLHRQRVSVNGVAKSVPQSTQKVAHLQINEPTFTMQLPIDWKETGSQDVPTNHSISWQATAKNADNRYLTVYIDTIPTTYAVNRELPVTVHGSQLSYGALSDNCAGFTPGGTEDVAQAVKLKPAPSVWQGVNFICNLPNVIDNQIGVGSTSGVNTVTVTGPTTGTHSYFFLYIDRNVQPDYNILFDTIQSFQAK
jgi:hypothetical protein